MAKGKPKTDEDMSKWPLERCFEELERIVSALESETTSLEDSLKLFERGMALSQRCTAELTAIERKIQVIVENSRGQTDLQPFEDETDDE